MTTALFSFCVGFWDRSHGFPVSAFVFVCLSVPLFWVGAFLAWYKKYKQIGTRPADFPAVRIKKWDWFAAGGPAGFRLHTDGTEAHDLTLAEFKIGEHDMRGGTLPTAGGSDGAPAEIRVWLPVTGSFARWDLLDIFRSVVTDNFPITITLSLNYRDYRDLRYRTIQEMTYEPLTREIRFGAPHYDYEAK